MLKSPQLVAGLGEQGSQESGAKCLLKGGCGWNLEDGKQQNRGGV